MEIDIRESSELAGKLHRYRELLPYASRYDTPEGQEWLRLMNELEDLEVLTRSEHVTGNGDQQRAVAVHSAAIP
jgi:hypothetical protein